MGNQLYEENKRLRAENDGLRAQMRQQKEQQADSDETVVRAILNGVAGLLSGKALIYVGTTPVQVRWMHEPAPSTDTITS